MQLLEERREVAVTEVAEELGATVRTVYRDLSVLERFGVPIFPEKRGTRSRWRVMDGYRRRLSVTLSWPEMVALTVGRDLLAGASGATFHESAISALGKIRGALPKELTERADALGNGVSASAGVERAQGSSPEVVPQILEAIERRETLRIEYRAPARKSTSEREVDPHHLHVQGGAVYLLAFDHVRGQLRTFAIARIARLSRTGATFQRQAGFRRQDHLQGALGPWTGRAVRIALTFESSAAPFVVEERVHPSQKSQLRADGRLDVTLTAPVSPQLIRWLMGFGAEVSVSAPASLAERLARDHAAAAGLPSSRRRDRP